MMYCPYSEKVKEVCSQIGAYYLQKNNNDYEATRKDIESTHITNIQVLCGDIFIHTSRPGVLIGKRGQNIDALEKYLGKKVKIVESDDLLNYLVPYPETEDETEYNDMHAEYLSMRDYAFLEDNEEF